MVDQTIELTDLERKLVLDQDLINIRGKAGGICTVDLMLLLCSNGINV